MSPVRPEHPVGGGSCGVTGRSWHDTGLQLELRSVFDRSESWNWRDTPREPVWVEITEEAYWDALNVLPPVKWARGGVETFLFLELAAHGERGPVAWVFGRAHGRCWASLIFSADYEKMRSKLASTRAEQ